MKFEKVESGFSRAVNNIAKSLVKEVEILPDNVAHNCRLHTGLGHISTAGYRCVHFKNFRDLDKYLSQEDPEWRTREWAAYWLRGHWAFQTSEYEREEIHKETGLKFRQQVPGSVRHTRKYNPKPKRIPQIDIATFMQNNPGQSLREIKYAIKKEYGIGLSLDTIRRIKKKYNL